MNQDGRGHGIRSGSTAIDGVLVTLSIVVVVVPAVIVQHVPPVETVAQTRRPLPATVQRGAPPPPVEPTEFRNLPPDEARAFNATVPFVTGPNAAARPFRFVGDADSLTRATDCLAAAVLYEAGDEAKGQRAVAQVVLNRLRHPAFPKSVCGVVFQGAERRTGCQFTFTCDGALERAYSQPFWDRARVIAREALAGGVYAPVGYATHYHTDWVVPYWQSSLDKIARVDTHLFFRWTGWWGTPAAFRRVVQTAEPRIDKLAPYSNAHDRPDALTDGDADTQVGDPGGARQPQHASDDPDTFLVALDPAIAPDRWPQLAAMACGDRVRCKYLGWRDAAAVPALAAAAKPGSPELVTMTFGYLRDRAQSLERRLWNCLQVPRPANECMRRVVPPPAMPSDTGPAPTTTDVDPAPALSGVRRNADPAPVALPVAQ